MARTTTLLLWLCALSLGASAAPAQTLVVYDPAARVVRELAGPPAGLCSLPGGPVYRVSPIVGAGLGNCPVPASVPAPPLGIEGDLAVDRVRDVVYVTDGTRIARISGAGQFLDSFTAPWPGLTALAFDAASGRLWISDGDFAASLVPPPYPACGPAVVPLATPPFLLPLPLLPATGMDIDPFDGSLFVCDAIGSVTQVLQNGAVGPRGTWSAPTSCLGPILGDVAVDAAAPAGSGAHYVTDGQRVAYILPGGAPAPTTTYTTSNCFDVPDGHVAGIGFAARVLPFGAPSFAAAGGQGALLEALGQSVRGNEAWVVRATGGPLGSVFALWANTEPACPVLGPIPGFPVHIGLFAPVFVAAEPANPGALALTLPIPAGAPVPAKVYLQGVFLHPSGTAVSTNGLALALARR